VTNFLTLLLFLFFAHLVGDVLARPGVIHRFKGKSTLVLIFHCYVWASLVSLPLIYYDRFELWKFTFLLIGHFAIDKWKGWVDPDSDWIDYDTDSVRTNKWVFIDQGLHFLQLIVVGI